MPSSTVATQAGSSLFEALDLYQAKPTRTHILQAVQMAERRNIDVVLPRHFEDGLASAGAYVFPIDD